MSVCYFESLKISNKLLCKEIANHLKFRQHLGKAIVVCETPSTLLGTTRKQWLKLARSVQNERSATINAERLLRLTNAITHMHKMQFIAKTPMQSQNAHVYFIDPKDLEEAILPVNTYSFYITCPINKELLNHCIEQLPSNAMIVDFSNSITDHSETLKPKSKLESQVFKYWSEVETFLDRHKVDITKLTNRNNQQIEAINDALDTLLDADYHFLQLASAFQHQVELAQPLLLDPEMQRQYDVLMLLAHRVQTLSPSSLAAKFTHNLNDDAFFLHDISLEFEEDLLPIYETIEHHKKAGRNRLARALTFAMSH
ncbi:MAG: hypothetical protein PVI21_05085 [Candidatus Woesebacteria bacterium]|jgi:hypothetical protein